MSLASALLASFAEKHYTNFRRARARTPKEAHGLRLLVLLATASHPPFIATKGPCWRRTCEATVAAFTDAIIQILHTVQSHVSKWLRDIHPGFYF